MALSSIQVDALAQEKPPIPEFDGKRVYLGPGIPENYRGVADQITRLEKAGTPTYYVVVLRSSGPKTDPTATRDYTTSLYDTWRDQAAARGLRLDPERSVVIVVAIENRQVAVHPARAIKGLGLSAEAIERDLIDRSGFKTLAADGKYPEAIVALLDTTDRWIGSHEATTQQPVATEPAVRPGVPITHPVTSRAGTSARDVAVGLGLALAVIVAAILGLVWMAHRRARGQLDHRIKEIRSRATDVMDHLDALKERLKLLPATDPDFRIPMAGETLALYDRVQGAVGRLWDRWLQVMDTLERAQKVALGITSPFKKKALNDAEAMLEQKGAFEEIDAGAQECAADMDRLNQAHEAARSALEAVAGSKPKIDAQVESIGKLGLPIAPYQSEATAIGAETDRARELIPADPIGARSLLEALRARGEGFIGRAERVAGLVQEARNVASALEGLRRQAAEHRSKGLRLDEDGGNPDPSLAQADQAHAAAVSDLRGGDPDAAAKELDTARSMVDRAKGTIEQVRAAREYCRREQPERERATGRLRAALPQAEADHRRLEHEFAATSWESAARYLDQVRASLPTFDRLAADAAASATDESQKYLAGARMLRQLAQQQQAALRLMSGLGEQLNALSAVRDECRRRRGELEALGRRVEGYFRQYDPRIGRMAREQLEEATRGREQVTAGFDDPRPDWPAVRQALAQAMEGYAIAQSQAEADVRSHQQAADEYGRARGELERVANLLAGRREDRVAANRRFRAAAEVLDQVGLDLGEPNGEWAAIIERIRGAVADLQQAERLAREDIRLAGQAQSELDEAARAIEQARQSFAMGAGVDTSDAEAALDRAGQLLQAQEYERAIECAGQARQAARRAYQESIRQSAWRQQQQDADRRRWEAGSPGGSGAGGLLRTGAAVAAAVILDHAVQSAASAAPEPESNPPVPEPIISPEPEAPETGVSTWESDTGQGTW
jgi:hypothetical protein